jgi:hypothetical protein
MAFTYYLVGATTKKTYALMPLKHKAMESAASLSISAEEPIKIQNKAYQVIDIYYKGKSVREQQSKGKV